MSCACFMSCKGGAWSERSARRDLDDSGKRANPGLAALVQLSRTLFTTSDLLLGAKAVGLAARRVRPKHHSLTAARGACVRGSVDDLKTADGQEVFSTGR